jgi:hypothetical protein
MTISSVFYIILPIVLDESYYYMNIISFLQISNEVKDLKGLKSLWCRNHNCNITAAYDKMNIPKKWRRVELKQGGFNQ